MVSSRLFRFVGIASLTAGMACVSGCGEAGVEGVVPVSGKVTYKDQPVADATVTFVGEGAGAAAAVGNTSSDGSYSLRTLNTEGAKPGKYTVLVTKTESTGGGASASMEEAKSNVSVSEAKQLLPAKYADASQSPLNVEVKAGGGAIDLKLED
jgi:hypothetical protein